LKSYIYFQTNVIIHLILSSYLNAKNATTSLQKSPAKVFHYIFPSPMDLRPPLEISVI